jgi:hypothetical protein
MDKVKVIIKATGKTQEMLPDGAHELIRQGYALPTRSYLESLSRERLLAYAISTISRTSPPNPLHHR